MILAANFKANHTRASTQKYVTTVEDFLHSQQSGGIPDLYLFPPASALDRSSRMITVGAQNCWHRESGAFTGELCTEQLDEFDIKTILIGHSERREIFRESQEIIDEKFNYFKELGYKIIYCIGEPLEARESGTEALMEHLDEQLSGIDVNYRKLIVAYEPIWAIGSGLTPESREIELVHRALSQRVKAPLLYGGSVKVENAHEILSLEHVSGVLIGSGALDADSFCKIIKIAMSLETTV